jgi:hypothetical protein
MSGTGTPKIANSRAGARVPRTVAAICRLSAADDTRHVEQSRICQSVMQTFRPVRLLGKRFGSQMTTGLCRTPKGWGDQDSAWVQYGESGRAELPRSVYEAKGYCRSFHTLPEREGPELVQPRPIRF